MFGRFLDFLSAWMCTPFWLARACRLCAPLMDVSMLKGTGGILFAQVVKPRINFNFFNKKNIIIL